MRIALALLLCLAAAAPARAQEEKKAAAPATPAAKPETKPATPAAKPEGKGTAAAAPAEKKQAPADVNLTLYAVGLAVARSLEVFALTPGEVEKVMQGVRDGAMGKPKFPLDEKAQQSVNDLARARLAVAGEKEKTKGSAYLDKAAKEKGAVKTESGAIVIPVQEGKGATPTAADKVKVHYEGKLVDGKVFDSSRQRGEPAEFPLGGVIKCWTEGLQKMKVGGRARVVCPAAIAYGEQGRPPVIPGNAVLTFDIELLDIVK
jgi:FKBP-type peptidyl-prolyl cis-trans isomerase